jgi:molecular chaperone HscB
MTAALGADGDAFAVLGLPSTFALDAAALRAALLRESLLWHPDRFALADAAQRHTAELRMAEVNRAHAALSDPLGRADALLARAGAPMPRGTDHVSCPGVLLSMMELKEEIAEARAAGDGERVAVAAHRLAEEERRSLADLGAAFSAWESAGAPADKTRELHARLAEATYLRRTAEDLARTPVA